MCAQITELRRRPYDEGVEPIVFVPNEQDAEHLAILQAVGLYADAAIRIALTSLAAEMTPVAVAMRDGALVAA
jgi:hypothetical protein